MAGIERLQHNVLSDVSSGTAPVTSTNFIEFAFFSPLFSYVNIGVRKGMRV
jgi:hypothetical protein